MRAFWSGLCLRIKQGSEQAEADGNSGASPVQMTCHLYREARERRSGEIPIKVFAREPWKGETQGSIQRSLC
jgi:hypothetical protein